MSSDYVEYLYNILEENDGEIAICDPVHCYPNEKIVFEQETFKRVYKAEDAIVEMLYQKSFFGCGLGKIVQKKTISLKSNSQKECCLKIVL